MFSTKITLLSLAVPVGSWQAWTNLDQSHLVIRVVVAVAISFGIFMAIVRMTEYAAVSRRAHNTQAREPVLFAHDSRRRRIAAAS